MRDSGGEPYDYISGLWFQLLGRKTDYTVKCYLLATLASSVHHNSWIDDSEAIIAGQRYMLEILITVIVGAWNDGNMLMECLFRLTA